MCFNHDDVYFLWEKKKRWCDPWWQPWLSSSMQIQLTTLCAAKTMLDYVSMWSDSEILFAVLLVRWGYYCLITGNMKFWITSKKSTHNPLLSLIPLSQINTKIQTHDEKIETKSGSKWHHSSEKPVAVLSWENLSRSLPSWHIKLQGGQSRNHCGRQRKMGGVVDWHYAGGWNSPLVFVFISGRTIVADDSYLKDHPICRDVTANCP